MAGFKVPKDGLTLLEGANAGDDVKLKPVLIGHFKNPRAFKDEANPTLPVIYE